MGIKDLNQLLKRICGSTHISHVPMCNFDGQKIAIDAALYVCVFKLRGHSKTQTRVGIVQTNRCAE